MQKKIHLISSVQFCEIRDTTGTPVIEVRILGPLALSVGARPVRLGPQQRILFIALLLARAQPVPRDRLAELLWGTEVADASSVTLRSHISHLRRALAVDQAKDPAADLIVTDRVGSSSAYTLRIDREDVDEGRFERLIADGHHALAAGQYHEAANLARDALALWRGEPLADVAHHPFAVPTITRLEALYRAAWRLWAKVLVQLGRYHEAIVELEGLVTRWPGDEDLRRLLIVCLWRSGRTEEAAHACQAGIELMLAGGLDVTGLQALQREVLRSAPSLDGSARLHRPSEVA